jgi:hypothetical protein
VENASISLLHSASFPGYQLPAKSGLLTAIRSTPSFSLHPLKNGYLIAKTSKVSEIRFWGLYWPSSWFLWKSGSLATIQEFSKLSIRKMINDYQPIRSLFRE